MIGLILRWMLAIVIAFLIGKLVSKLRLPAILGWLIAGMLLGPYAFQLMPHSGVSLVFTGITVSILTGPAPECAAIIQGTIATAAVLNEMIAVVVAKKGFEWAGELSGAEK